MDYYTLNNYFLDTFGEKIYKVSLDGGFSCPNRDGTISYGGCIFCNERGSGEFAGSRKLSITEQIDGQLLLIQNKFPTGKVIAYFQNFTNTYGTIEHLEQVYNEALKHPRVIGLAIATRPDCLPENVLALLSNLNKKTHLWLELGLQSSDDTVATFINRGYDLDIFRESTKKLNQLKIKFVTHIIVGLPNARADDHMKTLNLALECGTWGIKIHLLYIIKDTALSKIYEQEKFHILTKEEYLEFVSQMLLSLPEKVVVHRVTGDGDRETLIEPKWSLNKRDVLNSLSKKLREKKIKVI